MVDSSGSSKGTGKRRSNPSRWICPISLIAPSRSGRLRRIGRARSG
jgi:hypothetical protein